MKAGPRRTARPPRSPLRAAIVNGSYGALLGFTIALSFLSCILSPGYSAWVVLPVVLASGLLVGYPTALGAWRMTQQRERWAQGLCIYCAYDLRCSTDRCPECGWRIPRNRRPTM